MPGEPLHSKDRSLVICFTGWNALFSEFIGSNSYLGTANLNSVHVIFFPLAQEKACASLVMILL